MDRNNDEKQIISYLLGELEEDDRRQVEERLFTSDEYFDLLLVSEDDLIDDYVKSRLSAREREKFETHFLSTPERRERLRFAMAFRQHIEREDKPVIRPEWWRRLFSVPSLGFVAAAIILLALGVGIWRVFIYESELSKGLVALNKAYSAERPVEARISKLDYAPFPVTRGDEQRAVDKLSLKRAEGKIVDEAEQAPNAASLHALGKLYLTEKKFDEAIEQLEKALRIDDKKAQLHSDLGAALLEKGKIDRSKGEGGKSLEEFARSLEHLNRALELDVSLLEALFNRALLYHYMLLPDQEAEAWRAYLAKDSNSRWADEAREKLKRLEEKKVARLQTDGKLLPDFIGAFQSTSDDTAYELIRKNTEPITRQLLWWELLGAYLDLTGKGESDGASLYLQALSYAGGLQKQRSGDQFVSELARFYGPLTSQRQAFLAQAHDHINKANAALARGGIGQGFELYEEARGIFEKTGDHLESQLADYYIAYCLYRKSDFKRSLSAFSRIASFSRARGYLWLLENALIMIANIYAESNQFSTSLAHYNESLEVSRKIDDEYNTQKTLCSLAYNFKNLGDRNESLTYMQRCLERTGDGWTGARQMYRNFDTAAGIFISFGYYDTAAEYQKAALQQALEAKDPGFEHRSYMHLGAIYLKLQDHAEALRYTKLSYQVAQVMSDERADQRSIALSALQLGHVYRQMQDYDQAVASYDDAIHIYSDINLFTFLYEAHKGRLLCYIAQGNDSLAEVELQTVLTFFEENRPKIKEEKNRNSFFDLEQYVYDIAVDFEYSRKHNMERAFDYSEISRARSLFDLMSAGAEVVAKNDPDATIRAVSEPLMLSSIQKAMPEQVQILQYSVLDDKLLIWVISSTKCEVAEEKITLSNLTEKALSYWRSTSSLSKSETEETRRQAIELYEILIKPVESLLKTDKQICVIPDKALNYLPFNALVHPDTGRYLIQDYLLSFAPSANTFLLCFQEAEKKSGARDEKVMTVGDPLFNRDDFPKLSDLPSSRKEAEEVARCYKSGCCLVRESAEKARIKSEMGKADVIHIASHYVIDEHNPMLSKLLLTEVSNGNSKDQSSDSFLQAYDILQSKLPVTRLVALSACRTGIEQYYKGEGMIGMSRTFLAAGVPLVVASLWPVDSEPTSDLMIGFHKCRKPGVNMSVAALRQAQLDMIDNSRYSQPYFWAPFVMIGGYASF